jgi:hypothetical protein
MRLPKIDGFPAVRRLRHHAHILLAADRRCQAFENQHMIVRYQQANLLGSRGLRLPSAPKNSGCSAHFMRVHARHRGDKVQERRLGGAWLRTNS